MRFPALLPLILVGFVGLARPGGGLRAAEADAFPLITARVQSWVDRGYYPGCCVWIAQGDRVLYERSFGAHTAETEGFIASAGKWLISATPVYPGPHTVVATIDDANYTGTKTDTLVITIDALVRHAPTLNGLVDGSVQVLLPESITLNSSAAVGGDLLVPGLPSVVLNGQPTYVGTLDGTGRRCQPRTRLRSTAARSCGMSCVASTRSSCRPSMLRPHPQARAT